LIFKNEYFLVGAEIVKDKTSNIVLHVKWIWINFSTLSNCDKIKHMLHDFIRLICITNTLLYYSFPTIECLDKSELWDLENCYVYESSESNITIPKCSDNDIIGWYLGR